MSIHSDLFSKHQARMTFNNFEIFIIVKFFVFLLRQEVEQRKSFEGDTF